MKNLSKKDKKEIKELISYVCKKYAKNNNDNYRRLLEILIKELNEGN